MFSDPHGDTYGAHYFGNGVVGYTDARTGNGTVKSVSSKTSSTSSNSSVRKADRVSGRAHDCGGRVGYTDTGTGVPNSDYSPQEVATSTALKLYEVSTGWGYVGFLAHMAVSIVFDVGGAIMTTAGVVISVAATEVTAGMSLVYAEVFVEATVLGATHFCSDVNNIILGTNYYSSDTPFSVQWVNPFSCSSLGDLVYYGLMGVVTVEPLPKNN